MRLPFGMFGLLANSMLAATDVCPPQATVPPGCDRCATVAPNDTCFSISAKYSVSTYQLATVNKGVIDEKCDNLFPGEVLCLGIKGQDCTTTYVVKDNDTCVGIANAYNIPLSTLLANNPNVGSDCSNLLAGESLCVSSTIYVH